MRIRRDAPSRFRPHGGAFAAHERARGRRCRATPPSFLPDTRMTSSSSQKFIARHRAPRVQIEYDVELYGASRKMQLPFVVGVLAELSGMPAEPLPPVAERGFLEIDADNFDDRLKSMRPRVAFHVPDAMTRAGELSVDLTFERLDDFTPESVARRVAPLRALLEARTRLKDLLTYMDGKVGAEDLLARLLRDPALLASVAATGRLADAPSAG
jgi:type VI secretion system protein ImpB